VINYHNVEYVHVSYDKLCMQQYDNVWLRGYAEVLVMQNYDIVYDIGYDHDIVYDHASWS